MASRYVRTRHSLWLAQKYISKFDIDMSRFEDRAFTSFADFFGREKKNIVIPQDAGTLISPCDGLLSVYSIDEGAHFNIKGIDYTLQELIPDGSADIFTNGLCLVLRLEAKDYHHFCYFDDCQDSEPTLIPGQLHSVQPVAISRLPVFRQNKRYYHILDTAHFGKVMQIEVGAVLVGGVVHAPINGASRRGQESGRFDLCGSTIILMFTEEYRNRLKFTDPVLKAVEAGIEYPVEIGDILGTLEV